MPVVSKPSPSSVTESTTTGTIEVSAVSVMTDIESLVMMLLEESSAQPEARANSLGGGDDRVVLGWLRVLRNTRWSTTPVVTLNVLLDRTAGRFRSVVPIA